MKASLALNMNKAFESRVRMGIMSILVVNDEIDFRMLKEIVQTTDGNIASHIAALEKIKYVVVQKRFIGKKPNTSYKATKKGKDAFAAHLDVLANLIKGK